MNDNINENNINDSASLNDEEITNENNADIENSDIDAEDSDIIKDDIQSENFEAENDSAYNEENFDDENVSEEIIEEIYEEKTTDEKISFKIKKIISLIDRIPPEKRFKTISIMVSLLIIVILILTDIIPILPNAYNRFYIGNSYVISETQDAVFDKLEKNVIYAASGTIKCFGPDMDCIFTYDAPTGTPMLETSGDNAIVYYENSNNVFLITNSKDIKKINIKEKIKGVSVTSGSYYGIVREEPGYNSCVEVFKNGGSLIYKWHTNSFIMDIAVSDNGKYMVASAYDVSANNASTKLVFFDLSKESPVKELTLISNIVSELRFIGADTVAAFGDLYTQTYSAGGNPLWRVDYKGRIPKSYDIGKNNEIAFIFDRYSSSLSESAVEIYSKNGNLKGIYDSKDNIKYISCNNGYVLLSLDKQTVLLDNDADAVKIKNTNKNFKKAVIFDNFNFAFSISDGIAEIMSVKH